MNGSTYVQGSKNSKISSSNSVDAIYVSTNSCPKNCSFAEKGCYAKLGMVGITTTRLNKESDKMSALQLARAEAKSIDQAYAGKNIPAGKNLRLHVSGDCRSIEGAKVINKAIGRWHKRGGNIAWSYTHCWDHVLREVWSNVSMLASVDKVEDVQYVRQNGYAPAIVVAEHLSDKAYKLPNCDTTFIPCPSQTRGIKCDQCMLCGRADFLFENNKGIAFSAHGPQKNAIKKRLAVIQ
jgi:hypothetical protein